MQTEIFAIQTVYGKIQFLLQWFKHV